MARRDRGRSAVPSPSGPAAARRGCVPGATSCAPVGPSAVAAPRARPAPQRPSGRSVARSAASGQPRLPVDLRLRLQLARMTCVAERVPHARDRETRLPMIMHQAAPQALRQAVPLHDRTVERPPRRADHVQPMRLPADPEPRPVRMLNAVRARDAIPHALVELPLELRRLARHAGRRRRAHLAPSNSGEYVGRKWSSTSFPCRHCATSFAV